MDIQPTLFISNICLRVEAKYKPKSQDQTARIPLMKTRQTQVQLRTL